MKNIHLEGFRSTMINDQSSLISSDDSFQLSDKENHPQSNETIPSYSFLFDKVEHNFSTSSEISLIKPDHHHQNTSPQFNPFLLLFLSDDPIEVLDQFIFNLSSL